MRTACVAVALLLTGCVHYGNFTKPDMSQYDADRSHCYEWAQEQVTREIAVSGNQWMSLDRGKFFNDCMVARGYSKT